jgi:hypothetical protein
MQKEMRFVKRKWIWVGCTVALTIAGCGRLASPTPLERAAAQVTPGMTRSNVHQLFAEFRRSKGDYQVEWEFSDLVTRFQTNATHGRREIYYPTQSGLFDPYESCHVYFDTNDIINGIFYSRNDGRPLDTKPRRQ